MIVANLAKFTLTQHFAHVSGGLKFYFTRVVFPCVLSFHLIKLKHWCCRRNRNGFKIVKTASYFTFQRVIFMGQGGWGWGCSISFVKVEDVACHARISGFRSCRGPGEFSESLSRNCYSETQSCCWELSGVDNCGSLLLIARVIFFTRSLCRKSSRISLHLKILLGIRTCGGVLPKHTELLVDSQLFLSAVCATRTRTRLFRVSSIQPP